jgi:predicted Ser/Thr protein kinase
MMPPDHTPPAGTSPASHDIAALRAALRGQYAVERELGRGGMGIVLLARDERLDRPVALKVLPPDLAGNRETRERFLREARMAAQLSHPNIVPVYRADEIEGFAFFAMGFVDGESLGDRVRDRGALPPHDVVRSLREVAWALAYAHARGIVHRDVKPDNILIERSSGRAIVTDFGIARADFNPALTQDGHVLGTVHYMSPEQAAGEPLDGRSDLYALGCVGFLALSGRLPFDGTAPQAILLAHATKPPPPLRSVAPSVPAALAAVIDRCLAKRRDERFATGEELADALAKALDAVDRAARAHDSALLSGDAAMAVWRRAAELQAEAAARLESRLRAAGGTRALSPGSSATHGAADGAAGPSTPSAPGHASSAPTDAYRLRDVEAAALEAGISQRFVALAVAELQRAPQALQKAQAEAGWKERSATRLFGTTQRTVSVTRAFRDPPRVVLKALGRTLQAHPYGLVLRDTLGGHPLDGGVLVFTIPEQVGTGHPWLYTRYGVYATEVRVSMAALPGDPRGCEVTLEVDLRNGLGANLVAYTLLASGIGAGGGAIGVALGAKVLALTGAAVAAPAMTGAVLFTALGLAVSGPLYRWGMRKTANELGAALAAVEAGIRAMDVFGEEPPPAGAPTRSPHDDFLIASGFGS